MKRLTLPKSLAITAVFLVLFLAACGGQNVAQPTEPAPVEEAIPTSEPEEAEAVSPTEAPVDVTTAAFTFELLDECFVEMPEGAAYECGRVEVPVFHDGGGEETIELGVIRLLTQVEDPAEPLFMAAGGPGGTLINLAPGLAAAFGDTGSGEEPAGPLTERDIVLFTPRGTSFSEPELYCTMDDFGPYIDAVNEGVPKEERERAKVDSAIACFDRFVNEGIDLTAYNSVEGAADVNAIREALGYDKIVIYGESYGTLLAQHVMRDFPDSLTSVILDGTVPISAPTWLTQLDAKFQSSLDTVVALCAADEACSETYPSLPQDLEAVFEKLQAEPYALTFADFNAPVDGSLLAEAIFDSLYNSNGAETLPLLVDSLLNDRPDMRADTTLRRAVLSPDGITGFSWPTHFATVCSEDPVQSQADALSIDSEPYGLVTEYVRSDTFIYAELCDWLDLPGLSPETDEPISGEVPVMLFSGAFDPITPALSAEQALVDLPNSYAYVFPYGGHIQFAGGDPCAAALVDAFLIDPMSEPDGGCLDEATSLTFALPEESSEADSPESNTAEGEANRDLAPLVGESGDGWMWLSYTDGSGAVQEVATPWLYTVIFDTRGGFFAGADCNFVAPTYELDGTNLAIDVDLDSTADCAEGSLSRQFLELLEQTESFAVSGDQLELALRDGAGTLTFAVLDPLAQFRVETWEEAAAMFQQQCDAPGMVLLVDQPSGRFLQAYGLADTETGRPMQTGDRFEIGSSSKSFTVVLAMQLQEEGVWSLDDPMSNWLPEEAARIPNGELVTLRQLAGNTSGIWDYADPLLTQLFEADNLEQGFTPQELIDFVVENGEPDFAPGESGKYSSTNFILLGMAIEAATGESLADLYRMRIFEPLGMTNSSLLEGVPEEGAIVSGYYTPFGGETINTTNENGSQMWAAGGIISTAEDMARYAEGLGSGALFQSNETVAEMTTFGNVPMGALEAYGLGVGRYSSDPFGWGHEGQTLGFQTQFVIYPDADANVILMTNSASCRVGGFPAIIKASPALLQP